MMKIVFMRLILMGLFCFCLCKAECDDLKACARQHGKIFSIPRFGYDENPTNLQSEIAKEVINDLCRNRDLLQLCTSSMASCDTYQPIIETFKSLNIDLKKSMVTLCDYESEYIAALTCTFSVAQNRMKNRKAQTQNYGSDCLTKAQMPVNNPNGQCSALSDLMKCNSIIKETYQCMAPLMVKLHEGGVSVPCLSTYQALSSAGRFHADKMKYPILVGIVAALLWR